MIILSRRNPPSAGWVAIDEFEDFFFTYGGAKLLCAERRPARFWPLDKVQNRLLGPFNKFTGEAVSDELVLVVARTPSDLRIIRSLTGARKRFSKIAGYVIDSYFVEDFESSIREYDHIFSTTKEGADLASAKFGVPSSVLRQGFDCLSWASTADERSIDLIGFGRQPRSYHLEFQTSFHNPESKVLYLHSPIGTRTGPEVWKERAMMLKLLQRSKLSLAFHLGIEPQGQRPRSSSFVTSRWLESLAAGCVVVGKKPVGQMASEMFNWPNALMELPDEPRQATRYISRLIEDEVFVREARQRNVLEMYRRHDWRYRIRDILDKFGLPLPDRLAGDLEKLEALAHNPN